MRAIAIAALLSAQTAHAAPLLERTEAGYRITGRDYVADLTHSGAIASLAPGRGRPAIAMAPDRTAWVVRAGDAWITADELWNAASRPEPSTETVGDDLRIRFSATATAEGSALAATWEYWFQDEGAFATRATVALNAGQGVQLVAFPGAFAFPQGSLRGAMFPFHRGVALAPAFFDQRQEIVAEIPAGFADFVFLETASGTLAISQPHAEIPAADTGKRAMLRPDTVRGEPVMQYHVDRPTRIAPGGGLDTGWVLVQVGRDPISAWRAHWEASGGARAATLREKLAPETFDRLAKALLVKYPDHSSPKRFADFHAVVDRLLAPALLHLCGYMPGGHDANYPDYLPPDPARGTAEELGALVRHAQARGHFVMPYTNPTWWDEKSPTMQRLGEAAIALGEDGQPRRETYGPHAGAVVSPTHEGVRARIAETAREFKALGADFLFEDQVGARSVQFDGRAGVRAFGYPAGLLANSQATGRVIPVMVEGGTAEMLAHATGFSGNGALDWEQPRHLPEGTWYALPYAALFGSEHVALYPHNLAGERMAHTREDLRYLIAFGNQLAYDLNRGEGPWLAAMARLQREVVSRRFGQRVVGWWDQRATQGWTHAKYANGDEAIANWRAEPLEYQGVTIAPHGFLWRDGSLKPVAGWLVIEGGDALVIGGEVVLRE